LLPLIIGVGAFLRFHMLGVRSLWPAECFSVLVARQPWPVFLRTMWWGEGNMAFYYTLLRGWLLVGDSEVWLQSLSVLFGVLTIPAVYLVGKQFLSREVGLVAAALLAVHSFHIEHSEQLRSYSLLTLMVVLSTYVFLALVQSPRRKDLWVLYVLFSALALYAQIFSAFILCGQWLALKPSGIKRVRVLKILAAGVAIGILSAPLLAVTLLENKGQLDWVPPPSVAGMLNVVWGIAGADILALHGLVGSVLLLTLYVVAWIFAVWGLFRAGRTETEEAAAATAVSMLVWWLVFPLLAMTAISFLKPILYPRYLLMCVPAAVLLAGQGVATIARCLPRGRLVASTILVALIALSLTGSHEFDAGLKTSGLDWRGAIKYILLHREGGDAVILYNFSGNWAWDYYASREREAGDNAPTPTTLFPLSFDRASIESRTAPYRRVWIVLHQDLPTPQNDANKVLLVGTIRDHFRTLEEKDFTGMSMFPGEDVSIHLALYAAVAPEEMP
jgi:mannosyltransferase